MNKQNLDKISIGAVIGLLAPIAVFLLFYYYNFSQFEFLEFLKRFENKDVFRKTLPAMLFINLGLVVLLTKKDYFKFCKGVIASSIVYATIFVIVIFS